MEKLPKRKGDRAGAAFDDMGMATFVAGWVAVLALAGLVAVGAVAGVGALFG